MIPGCQDQNEHCPAWADFGERMPDPKEIRKEDEDSRAKAALQETASARAAATAAEERISV